MTKDRKRLQAEAFARKAARKAAHAEMLARHAAHRARLEEEDLAYEIMMSLGLELRPIVDGMDELAAAAEELGIDLDLGVAA